MALCKYVLRYVSLQAYLRSNCIWYLTILAQFIRLFSGYWWKRWYSTVLLRKITWKMAVQSAACDSINAYVSYEWVSVCLWLPSVACLKSLCPIKHVHKVSSKTVGHTEVKKMTKSECVIMFNSICFWLCRTQDWLRGGRRRWRAEQGWSRRRSQRGARLVGADVHEIYGSRWRHQAVSRRQQAEVS